MPVAGTDPPAQLLEGALADLGILLAELEEERPVLPVERLFRLAGQIETQGRRVHADIGLADARTIAQDVSGGQVS